MTVSNEQYVQRACPRLAEVTFPYVCGIAVPTSIDRGLHLGTALRCRIRGERYIVTAAHVISKPLTQGHPFVISAGYGVTPVLFSGRATCDSVWDIAICWLPDEYPDDLSFWEFEGAAESIDNHDDHYLFTQGFPGIQSYFNEPMQGISSKSLSYGAMRQTSGLPSSARDFHFGLNYDATYMKTALGEAAELVAPYAMSGSPVWALDPKGVSSEKLTKKELTLAGTLVEYHEAQKVLLATKIDRLNALLAGTSPRRHSFTVTVAD